MTIQTQIQHKIQTDLAPEFLDVVNESAMHNVPENSETHFKVTVVSDRFEGHRLIARHRMVNQLLAVELQGPVHALALHTLTPDEWFDKAGQDRDSPPCLGGEKSAS